MLYQAEPRPDGKINLLSVHDAGRALPQSRLVSRRNVFLGQRRSFAEEILLHLLHQELLRFRVQGCRRYSLSSIFCRSIHSDQAFLET